MTSQELFLAEIEAFLSRTGMAHTTFGLQVLRDGKFVSRLRGGGKVTLETADRVRAWIATRESDKGEAA